MNKKLLLTILCMIIALPSVYSTILFQDDFEDGLDPADWDTGSGVSASGGYMQMSGTGGWSISWGARTDTTWTTGDYSVITFEAYNVTGNTSSAQGMYGIKNISADYDWKDGEIYIYRQSAVDNGGVLNGGVVISNFMTVTTFPQYDAKIQYYPANTTTKWYYKQSGTDTWSYEGSATSGIDASFKIGVAQKTGSWAIGEMKLCDTESCDAAPTPAVDNETLETAIDLRRDTPITVNSQSFTTIYAANFIADYNGSAYTSTTIESVSLHPLTRTQNCRVTIDGVDYGSSSNRTMSPNAYGNAYLFSEQFSVVANETYLLELQCRRTQPAGNILINKTDTLVHLLYDQQGNQIPNSQINDTYSISSSSYQLLFDGTFNTSAYNLTTLERNLIIDGKILYNYASSGTISLIASINGTNSSEFLRYGTAGTSGDGGGVYVIHNVPANASVPVQIWGKSTTSDGSVTITATVKEHISHPLESGNINITGKTISSSTWTEVARFEINNTHANQEIIAKGGISTTGSVASTVYYNITVDGQTSQVYQRAVAVGQNGVSVVQELFNNLAIGMYNVTLNAKVDAGTATINGGNVGIYAANEGTPEILLYNVSVYDIWDNTSLQTFNVSNEHGLTFATTNGYVSVVGIDTYDNLTIRVPNYYTQYVFNHNTSENLNTTAYQAVIRLDAYEIITEQKVTPANFTIDGITKTDSQYFYIKAGTYNATFSANTYFDKTVEITVSALENATKNITSVSGTVINVTASNAISGASINSFTVTISNANYSYTEDYSTTSGWISVSAIQGVEFNLSINATGYALANATVTPNASLFNYTFLIYTQNSILFMIYDEVTGDLINDTEFKIEIIGSYMARNVTTSNGSIYTALLTPDGYEIRYYSTQNDDYKLRSYFTDVTQQSYQQIDLYALNDTSTDITSATITFVVYNQDLDPVENMRVTVSRYYLDENAFIQVFSRNTNTAGQAVGTFETIDAFYQYQVKLGDTIYYTSSSGGTQFTATATIPIYINLETTTYATLQTFDTIPTTLRYVNTSSTTGYVQYNWSYSTTLPVCLYVNDITAFGQTFSQSSCTSGASGSIQIPINSSGLTKDYVARGLINYNNQGYKVKDTLSFTVNLQPAINSNAWKDLATFIAMFALIVAWFMGLRYPTVSIVMMSGIFVILTLPPLRIITISTSIGMWVVAIGLLLLIKVKRQQ